MHQCIFCQIIEKKIPARVVWEDDQILAFHDIAPQAPCHLLIIPKKHIPTLNDVQQEDQALIGHLICSLPQIAKHLGLDHYRLRCHIGAGAGQEVFHLHWHLLN